MFSFNKNKCIQILINIIPTLIIFLILLTYNGKDFSILIKLLIVNLSIILMVLSIYFQCNKRTFIKKTILLIQYGACIFLIILSLLYKYNLEKYLISPTAIKELVLSAGNYGKIIFICIQILQVTLIPIPSVLIILVGTLIYGPLMCTIYCILGVIIGSIISFVIGRTFGKKLVFWFIGKEKAISYLNKIKGRESLFVSLIFIFPFMPDDVICMVAGITDIKFYQFLLITIIVRPISVILLSYFGGSLFGDGNLIISFIILLLFVLVLGIIAYKNKSKISIMLQK